MKKGTLKFILNSTLDTLPTRVNLLQWKKASSDKCGLCSGRETSVHVLSACPVSLNQGRFKWRHDNILHFIANCVDDSKFKVFADLPGFQTEAGGTIPPNIAVQSQKPDLVIISKKKKEISMFELTVPYEHNIHIRHREKTDRYAHFKTDIQNYKITSEAFEIGARGYISSENKGRLKQIYNMCNKDMKYRKFEETICSMAMDGSQYIYLSRKEKEWHTPAFLTA